MSKAFFVPALAAMWLTSPMAHADNVDLALEAFHETCLAHGPDFERTAAVAKTRGWTPLSGDAALAPVDDVDAFQGWKVTGNDLPAGTMIAVTKATLNGKLCRPAPSGCSKSTARHSSSASSPGRTPKKSAKAGMEIRSPNSTY